MLSSQLLGALVAGQSADNGETVQICNISFCSSLHCKGLEESVIAEKSLGNQSYVCGFVCVK